MVDFQCMDRYEMNDLLRIMELLRAPDGCPWDKVQTHKSIRRNMLEEAYEVAEAIDNEDFDLLKEELGDVLLQVVFHARMAQEAGRFTFEDVVDGVAQKLVFRHPHVFGTVNAEDRGRRQHLGGPEAGGKIPEDRRRHAGRGSPVPACPHAGGKDPEEGPEGRV